MADIHISKIKVRRGTNAEINSTRFDQGELIHATDSKRLFVGNGVLSGGNPVSSKVHPPLINYSSLSTTLAEVGDLVSVNSIWYQLTASPYSSPTNWGDMGTKFSTEFVRNNVSTINMAVSGLSASKINANTVTNGIKITDDKLQLDYRTNFFEISSNQLSIKTGGITTREVISSFFSSEFVHSNNVSTVNMAVGGLSASKINPDTITNGIKIADTKLQLDYRTNFFEISSNQLSIKTGGITTREILSSSFGDGLSGGNGKSISLTVSPTDFSFSSGILSANYTRISAYGLNTQFHPPVSAYDALSALNAKIGDTTSFGNVIYQLNSFPLLSSSNWIPITKNGISIYDTLTGSSTRNSTNSLSSIFNGSPSQNTDGVVPGITLTSFTALSSNGLSSVTITLSSAGFIAFAGDYTSETGKSVNRFAIPIFTY